MKRVAVGLVVIVGAAVVAMGIFLATFDADRFRPLVVSKLQDTLGRPVALERLSLGWQGGIALQLRGVALYEAAAQQEPMVSVESASALVRLLPLLRKQLEVSSVVLHRPMIRAVRDAQGRVNLPALAAASPAASGQTGIAAAQSAAPSRPAQPSSPSQPPVAFKIASLRINDGTVHWTDEQSRPRVELWLRQLDVTVTNIAPGRPMDVELHGALASERPNLSLSGRMTLPDAGKAGSLERLRLSLERLPLEGLLADTAAAEPHLRGTLSATLEGSTPTLAPDQMTNALSGHGGLKLDEPRIANLNLLRAVFDKLSMLPGLVQALEARLPESYKAKLAATDTVLQPIDLSMTLEQGLMRFADLFVQTDTFGLAGSGGVSLDGDVDVQSLLRIEPAFSSAIIASVNELQSLTNARGELELPVRIQGRVPRITPVPDLQYVASKVLVTKATDLLGQLLRREGEPSPEAQPPGGQPQTPPEPGELLGQFLRRALEKNSR